MTLAGNLICQGAKSDKSPDQAATTAAAAHSANNIIISSHHQVTRSRSIMNVKLTSFSLSRCKMIVHSKSRPGPGSETSFITGAGSEHRWPPSPVSTLHCSVHTLPGWKRISAQQTENKIVLCVPGYCLGLGRWH